MIKQLILSSALALAVSIPEISFALDFPKEDMEQKVVMVNVNNAYSPGGFDSYSDAFVVASGMFPNGCYKWRRAEVNHDPSGKVHLVRSYATVSQGLCIMVMIPFSQEIRLGQLQSGEHKIRFINGDGTFMEKTMIIE